MVLLLPIAVFIGKSLRLNLLDFRNANKLKSWDARLLLLLWNRSLIDCEAVSYRIVRNVDLIRDIVMISFRH